MIDRIRIRPHMDVNAPGRRTEHSVTRLPHPQLISSYFERVRERAIIRGILDRDKNI